MPSELIRCDRVCCIPPLAQKVAKATRAKDGAPEDCLAIEEFVDAGLEARGDG
jgi:hypothetical protein